MAYNPYVRNVQEFLRRKVKRGSLVWNYLMSIKNCAGIFRKKLNARKWANNTKEFDAYVHNHAQRVNDFFFVQVGAHNGVSWDPIYNWVRKYGWSGILIEPQPKQFKQLVENYKDVMDEQNLVFENIAIAAHNGTQDLYMIDEAQFGSEKQRAARSGLASFFPDKALSTYAVDDKVTSISVKCKTMDNLLESNNVNKIDLLQIDTEGFDYEVIKLVNFDKIKPAIIHFENRHLSSNEYKECLRYLREKGYKVLEEEYDTAAIYEYNDALR